MGKYLRSLARDEISKGNLRSGPALLLLTLADRVRDFTSDGNLGQLYAGERTVAGWIGRSQPTYRKWRSELIDADLVKRIGGRPGVAARYQLFPLLGENPGVITSGESPSEQDRKPVRTIEPQENLNPLTTEEELLQESAL